jgi:uncharacterized protein YndB with AHSA1/START domain
MNRPIQHTPDPRLDLVLERTIDVPTRLVWAAWTEPQHILKWFTPEPWQTVDCEIDLRPGGVFRTVMRSPDGEDFPNSGCFLEIVENEKLVFTSAMGPGYRPIVLPPGKAGLPFTAVITLEPAGDGTKYTALVIHGDEDARKQHEEMGFHHGWGKALDQLVALAKTMR